MSEQTIVPIPIAGKKLKWEHVALMVLGGVAVASSGMLYFQWSHATVGRRVTSNVIDFLKLSGAKIEGNTIVGGALTAPLPVPAAVTATVSHMIQETAVNLIQRQRQQQAQSPPNMGMTGPSSPPLQQQQQQIMTAPTPTDRNGVFPEPPISGKTGLPVTSGPGTSSPPPQVNGHSYSSEPDALADIPKHLLNEFSNDTFASNSNDMTYRPSMPQ